MCIMRAIILTLFVTFIGLRAFADSSVTRLDSHNLDQQHFAFTIKAVKRGAIVNFEVYVQSKNKAATQSVTADLEMFDGTNWIVSCPVAKAQFDERVGYAFSVSPKYLTKSKFTFSHDVIVSNHSYPDTDVYWFYLADFVDEK
jgi:hypothetical protein